jgi:hypothetical protein
MRLTKIKNERGELAGILIPPSEFTAVINDVKKGSPLHQQLQGLMESKEHPEVDAVLLPTNHTTEQANAPMLAMAEEAFRLVFAMGQPYYYNDGRCGNPGELIRANPDGSEDLVACNFAQGGMYVIKQLAAPGSGQFAYLTAKKR